MLWVPWPTSYHRVCAKEGKACADLVLILQSFTSYNLVFDFCIDKVATISFCHTLRGERKWQHNTGEVQESFVFVPTQSDYMKMWEYLEELWKFENNFESHIVSFVGWNLNLQKILFEKQNLNDGTLWGNQLASEKSSCPASVSNILLNSWLTSVSNYLPSRRSYFSISWTSLHG